MLAREAEELERQNWLAARKEEGSKIDPATAKVMWEYGQILDPYGVRDLPPEESLCRGESTLLGRRNRTPFWVAFYDLPEATRDALQARIDAGDPTLGNQMISLLARWSQALKQASDACDASVCLSTVGACVRVKSKNVSYASCTWSPEFGRGFLAARSVRSIP